MSKLTDTLTSYTESRERLLALRREYASLCASVNALLVERDSACRLARTALHQLVERLDAPPESFADYDPAIATVAADLFDGYAQCQKRLAATEPQQALFEQIIKARRAYRKLVEDLPALIHADMAGMLSNGVPDEDDIGPTDRERYSAVVRTP